VTVKRPLSSNLVGNGYFCWRSAEFFHSVAYVHSWSPFCSETYRSVLWSCFLDIPLVNVTGQIEKKLGGFLYRGYKHSRDVW